MRLALRRGASARAASGEPGRPSRPGDPLASLAVVIDGTALWVAVDARPGRLALRHAETAEVVDLPTEVVTDRPGHLGARIDLTALDGSPGRHDVVHVHDGDVTPVLTEPLPPAATRTGTDGRTQHVLVRTPEGTLRVRTTVAPPAAGLLAVRALPEAIELTLVGAGPQRAVLGTADDGAGDDGEPAGEHVLVSWPVDEHGVVTITRESVLGLEPGVRPALTGSPGAWRGVRRRDNDLVDPRAGASLPQLDQPDHDSPLLRLPWSREALLQVRVFGAPASPEPGGP